MAIRTTELLVRSINDQIEEDADLTPFIETANNIVENVCLDSGYNEATLELIERWLSAHFYHINDPRAQMEQAGKVQVSYQGRTYTGLRHTSYGQQAMLLDYAGNLKILDDNKKFRIKAKILYLGRPDRCAISNEDS